MDSKEGIAQVAPDDARAAGLLDPLLPQSGLDDTTMADPPRKGAGGPGGSPTSPGENPRRESCCLYIRVLRDSDIVLEQDGLVFQLMYLSHHKLPSRREGIRPKCVNIAIGLWWSN